MINSYERNPEYTEIFIKRLTIRAQLGVFTHEKGRTQPLILTMRAWAKVKPVKDDIVETVDYNLFSDTARDLAENQHFDLVETFLNTMADRIMEDDQIVAGEFTAEKPEAIEGAECAGAVVYRRKD
ncbi:dihydroneopterin aldolase [Hirschia maritima]|uniref:dihydroneopterin aldolase n=1 Tax=Hirschia maritima TaxID=1121961 RepID=UPI0003621257|nr:dihydroneopterin aldolase [Hirschia maritima]